MNDRRFFKSKTWRDSIYYNDVSNGNPITILKAIKYAQKNGDAALEAYGCITLAKIFQYERKYSEAFDWLNKSLMLDTLLDPLSPVKQFVYKEAGRFYSDFGTYKTAAKFMKMGIEISLVRDSLPTIRLFSLYSNYAKIFLKNGLDDSCLFYYRKAIEIGKKIGYQWESSGLNNYGMIMHDLGKPDSALNIFLKARGTLKLITSSDTLFLTSIDDNIAEVYASRNECSKALPLFNQKYEYSYRTNNISRIIDAGIRSAMMMVKLSQFANARARINSTDSTYKKHIRKLDRGIVEKIIRVNFELALQSGNSSEALNLQQQLLVIKDSILANAQADKLRKLENILLENTELFNRKLEIEKLKSRESEAQARFNRIVATSATVFGVFIVAIIILLYRRRIILNRLALKEEEHKRTLAESNLKTEQLTKNQLRQQLELNRVTIEQESYKRELAEINFKNEQLERAHVSQQLELKKRDVTDYALAYSQRKKILDEVLTRLKSIKKSGNPVEQLQELTIELKRQLKGDAGQEIESGKIEKVNHEFFEKLREICPDLTKGEKDLVGLMRMNFSSKEISALKNISPASVRISKFRLKKKLGLKADEELTEFIMKL